MGKAELTAAGLFFDAHPNGESHVELNPNKTGAEVAFVEALLPGFGRCGGSKRDMLHGFTQAPNPYPPAEYVPSVGKDGGSVQVPCTKGRVFFTAADLEAIFLHNDYPAGFILAGSPPPTGSPPPPLAAPPPSPLLTWARQWVLTGLVAGIPQWWAPWY